jgi:hypothetical protein
MHASGGREEVADWLYHMRSMKQEEAYPYTLEVLPCDTPAGYFRWVIRERGKLLQRSDKPHPSEEAALKSARAELDRVIIMGRSR